MRWTINLLTAIAAITSVLAADIGPTPRHVARRVTYRHPGPNGALPPERLIVRQATSSSAVTAPSAAITTNSSLPKAPTSPLTSVPSPRPTPMDLQLSYAISEPCLRYLSTLLSSQTFTSCLPFSLLLTTSTSFGSFLSASAPTYEMLNTLLAYVNSPRPSSDQCDTYMSNAALAIAEKGKCAADITSRVPSVLAAANGLGNAPVMRQAAGLVNPDTGVYCYIEAKASDRPDDLYLWSIPSGINVPASSTPTCSKCSQLLLGMYAQNSNNYASLNSTIINRAISTVNSACGAGFVQYYSYSAASSAARPTFHSISLFISVAITAFWVFVA